MAARAIVRLQRRACVNSASTGDMRLKRLHSTLIQMDRSLNNERERVHSLSLSLLWSASIIHGERKQGQICNSSKTLEGENSSTSQISAESSQNLLTVNSQGRPPPPPPFPSPHRQHKQATPVVLLTLFRLPWWTAVRNSKQWSRLCVVRYITASGLGSLTSKPVMIVACNTLDRNLRARGFCSKGKSTDILNYGPCGENEHVNYKHGWGQGGNAECNRPYPPSLATLQTFR